MNSSFKPTTTVVPQSISLTNSDMYCHPNSPFYLSRGDDVGRSVAARFADLGELEQSVGNGFHHQGDAVYLSTSSIYNEMRASNDPALQFGGGFNSSLSSGGGEMGSSSVDTGHLMMTSSVGGGGGGGGSCLGNNNDDVIIVKRGGGAGGVVADQHTDTSTDTTTDDKIQFTGALHGRLKDLDSMDQSKWKLGEQKALCRLAQNREAARKSRMRKKAYLQQLESSKLKLMQIEQDMKRTRKQGVFASSGIPREPSHSMCGNGASAFDAEYARWLDEHQQLINELRSAVNSHVGDGDLRYLVDSLMSHYDEIFRLKIFATKSDVFHMLSGMWKTPAERCFMWLGGFRSSGILKILGHQIDPLTKDQLMGITNLEQTSQDAEDALSQGMEALQQSLVEALSFNTLGPRNSGNVEDYMGQMAIAMSKLEALEDFVYQADLLRLNTLQQLQRILTPRQAARALLAINDYKSRLRALSSLWLARPKE